MDKPIAGIFVGGRGARMGGRAKGLLRGPDGRTLVERLTAEIGPLAEVVLVGEAAAYAERNLEAIADDPRGIGPLGGLTALLRRAEGGTALVFACDMPWISRALVEALLRAPGEAPVVAPRRGGRWEPLCARYDASRVLPLAKKHAASGTTSLQALLDAAAAWVLPEDTYDPSDLRDWDEPSDMARFPAGSQ